MVRLNIKIDALGARELIEKATALAEDRQGLYAAMATGVEAEVKDHLVKNYLPKDKRGNFWERVYESTEVKVSGSGATVALTETGVALRYYGGEVYPGKNPSRSGPRRGQPTKALAIPSAAVPVKRGRQAAPFQMGVLAYLRRATSADPDTVGYLVDGVEKPITRGPKAGQMRIVPKPGGRLLYTLRLVTRHSADKNILPPDGNLLEAAERGALEHIGSF